MTGSPRRELESLYVTRPSLSDRPGSSAGRPTSSRGLATVAADGQSSPRIPSSSQIPATTSLVSASNSSPRPLHRKNKYVQKASLAELTAFAFETFRRQPSLIGDTEAGRCFLQYPWHETSLGPLNNWPAHYLGYITMALSMPTPMMIGLGPEYLQIYNDGYIEISGDFHPEGFAKPAAKAWGSIWEDSVGPRKSPSCFFCQFYVAVSCRLTHSNRCRNEVVAQVVQEKKSFSKHDHLVWQQPAHVYVLFRYM